MMIWTQFSRHVVGGGISYIAAMTTRMFCFQDVIGKALPMIGNYGDLDNTQQVVALIDEVR